MADSLDKLTIRGFKSIRELENFGLTNLNVLIGGNGAGKSNFIEFLRVLREMAAQNLAGYVLSRGGADSFLFNGPKQTSGISAQIRSGESEYSFEIEPTADEKFLIKSEEVKIGAANGETIGKNNYESRLSDSRTSGSGTVQQPDAGRTLQEAVSNLTIYHFHDTSALSPMRRSEIVEDNLRLRSDAANIAPFLLMLQRDYPSNYREIISATSLVIPFFDGFLLEPKKMGEKESVRLAWHQKGSDYPMQPYHFSDGSIRFICLATALLQPNPPSTIIIDEPELGLHPSGIAILAELITSAAKFSQLIVATQSPALIDYFGIDEVIVVNRKKGASTFERLQEKDYTVWLEEYSIGELWSKNVIAGGPAYD